jgi:hypothetical protein
MDIQRSATFSKSMLFFLKDSEPNSRAVRSLNTVRKPSIRNLSLHLRHLEVATLESASLNRMNVTTLISLAATFRFRNSIRSPKNTQP